MQRITLQDIIDRADGQTHGQISKNLIDDKGPTPLVLMAAAAAATMELLVKRGVLTHELAENLFDQGSAADMLKKAAATQDADNSGKYTVSIEQFKNDIFAEFPDMRAMEATTTAVLDKKAFDLMLSGLYVVVINQLKASGYLRNSIIPAVTAQAGRLTQEATEIMKKLPPTDPAVVKLRKMYDPDK